MENSQELRETATKIFVEGGNNADRIGGSSTVIFHQNEKGRVARVMYDCGALFAPEGIAANSFVADVLKYLSVDDVSLKKAFSDKSPADINKIREIYKEHGIGSKKLDAMFITHMHEDHIGGLINLLRAGVKFPKIYASEPTIGIIERLCQDAGISNIPEMQKINPYQTVKINDNVEVSAIPVSHSTAGAYAFYTKTSYDGRETGILNMGDYNTEKTPIGEGFDEEKFEEFMKGKPLNNILVDSTSATLGSLVSQNPVTHEEAVQNVAEICKQYNNKMIATPIISRSIENLYNFLEAAKKSGRTVFLDGYMLRHTYDVLQRQGLMSDYKDVVYQANDTVNADARRFMQQVPAGKRMMVFSGAFAEGEGLSGAVGITGKRPSGFVKFVNNIHHDFPQELLKDSVVVAAQRAIPVGSVPERQRSMYKKAEENGAIIIQTETDKDHSLGNYPMQRLQRSGHANGYEMKKLIELCNEVRGNKGMKMFVSPVHGDSKQLVETAKVATKAGAEVYIPLNGDIIHIEPNYVQAKKRQKDDGKNTYMWLGFSEVANEFGDVVYYEMSDWEEKIKDNGKVLYSRKNVIAEIAAGNGKAKSGKFVSALSEAEKRQKIEDKYEGEAMRESMRKNKFKNCKKLGRGGR